MGTSTPSLGTRLGAVINNRFTLLQIRHQLTPSAATQAALADFLSFLEEYGE